MKRTRRTAIEWQQFLDAKAARGMSDRAVAAAYGVSVASLGNWRRRLAATDARDSWMVEVTELL